MVAARIIVENLPYRTTEGDVRALFEIEGEVVKVSLSSDHITGQPQGIAYVDMSTPAEARGAAEHLDHVIYGRRRLHVKLAEGLELADLATPVPVSEPASPRRRPLVRPHRPERSPGR